MAGPRTSQLFSAERLALQGPSDPPPPALASIYLENIWSSSLSSDLFTLDHGDQLAFLSQARVSVFSDSLLGTFLRPTVELGGPPGPCPTSLPDGSTLTTPLATNLTPACLPGLLFPFPLALKWTFLAACLKIMH